MEGKRRSKREWWNRDRWKMVENTYYNETKEVPEFSSLEMELKKFS